ARPPQAAADALAAEGLLLRYTDITKVARAAEEAVRQEKAGTHADEIETSLMLFLAPASVRMERAVADGLVARDGPLTRDVTSATGHVSPSGAFGDPTLTDPRKGQTLVEAIVAGVLSEIDALAASAPPPGTPSSPLAPSSPTATAPP